MTDEDYMRRALHLAEKGRNTVRHGAMVGAVAVQGDRILGEGFHPAPGEPHAEVFALENVSDHTPGVTLYVNLEPCAHTGRTPPCADMLIRKGVSRVVCAMVDPDARVSGGGISRIREAGIPVDVGLLQDEALRLNEVFVKHRTTGMPFITLKLAQTLDGCIATSTGDARWITSEASRSKGHELRAEAGAVLVGRGTVETDDPELSVRHVDSSDPVKIVLDSTLSIRTTARVFGGADLIVVGKAGVADEDNRRLSEAGAEVWRASEGQDGLLCLREVLSKAGSEGLTHVLIEGGSQVAASALKDSLVDRVAVFIAPKLLGEGLPAIADMGIRLIDGAIVLEDPAVKMIGGDIYYSARVAPGDC